MNETQKAKRIRITDPVLGVRIAGTFPVQTETDNGYSIASVFVRKEDVEVIEWCKPEQFGVGWYLSTPTRHYGKRNKQNDSLRPVLCDR